MPITRLRMDPFRINTKAPAIPPSGRRVVAQAPPRLRGIPFVCACISFILCLTLPGSSSALPLFDHEEDPAQAMSRLDSQPGVTGGGYVTTNFTPPWTNTDSLTIFVSSSTHSGNLGGLEGARVICQNLATAQPALAGTTWYPILSDSTWDASSLTGKSASSAPIYNIDGTVIAASRAALWSGGALATGVKGTETGATRYDNVYTGTNATGGKAFPYCSNWTSPSGNGTIGGTNETGNTWITGFQTACSVLYRIYCIGNYNPYQPTATPTPTVVGTNTPTPTPLGTATFTPTSTITPTRTATPTASNTPTITPTPVATTTTLPTPLVANLNFQVVINSTPVPSLPISVAGTPINTDPFGYISTTADSSASITVETGLPAVSFTPFTARAGNLHGLTVIIEATRLIDPFPDICAVMVGNVPSVFFPYSNKSGVALSVPLSLNRLNRMLTPSGVAAPSGVFAPGITGNGFTLPMSHFQSGPALVGTWEFLATSVTVPASPPTCAATGNPNPTPPATPQPIPSCTSFDLSIIFTEAKRTITALSEESVKAAARKEWRPVGNVRQTFLKGGATSLNQIISIVKKAGKNLYSCTAPPISSSCTAKTIDKKQIKRAFNLIFPKNLPPGLGRVKRRIPIEKARYGRIVTNLPTTAYSCP